MVVGGRGRGGEGGGGAGDLKWTRCPTASDSETAEQSSPCT